MSYYKDLINQNVENKPDESLEVYDSSQKYWLGVVEDNNDSEFLGRCKIKVFGKTDGIPIEDLPWYTPKNSNIFAGGSSKGGGSISIPKIGSLVQVYFQDEEDIYNCEYTVLQNLNQAMLLEMSQSYINATTLFYDEDEKTKIMYTPEKGLIIFKDGSYINIDKNNDIIIQHTDGMSSITLKGGGNVAINADNKIWLNSPQVVVGAINNPMHPIIKGDIFMQWAKAISAIIDTKLYPNPAATTTTLSFEPLMLSAQGYVAD